MDTFNLTTFPLLNKTLLMRVDFNIPLKAEEVADAGKVADNSKIKAALPTIQFLLEKNCKIILLTHLGRPEGKIVESLRTNPLALELQRLLPRKKIIKLDDCFGEEIQQKIKDGKAQDIFLLENVRFYHQEEDNNPVFAHALASLADIYVNNAFGDCHRNHASIQAITKFLPAIPGLLVEKEIERLRLALNPKKPAIWILGGGKLEKIRLLKKRRR